MLLVVLRQKAQKEGTAGEYRRGAKSPKIHTLKQEGIAWQAWVSDQVTLIISGAQGKPPPSFADWADSVQQEFDAWWAQELHEAQSPKEMLKTENILASTLTPEPPRTYITQKTMELPEKDANVFDPSGMGCTARLLLLSLLKMQWVDQVDAGADLCSFVQWLAKLGKLSAILSAVSLVELLLRGATLNVNEPTGEEEEKTIAADTDLALAMAFALMGLQTSLDNRTAAVHGVLCALLKMARQRLEQPASMWGEDLNSESLSVQIFAPTHFSDRLAQCGAFNGRAEEDKNDPSQRWLNLLDQIGQLPGGRCIECSNTWTWDQDQEGGLVSFSALQPDGGAAMMQVLQALELWLMESCPLLDDGAAELATSAGNCSTPATTAGASTTTEMRELQEMLENGVLWEVPDTFADRLVLCDWWRNAESPRWSAALPLLMLALFAATEQWIWELPWTQKFRFHLAYALYIVRSWAECEGQDPKPQDCQVTSAGTSSFAA
eukprot:symbB.v1.2.014912.t1/scaffold1100.1/size328752/2